MFVAGAKLHTFDISKLFLNLIYENCFFSLIPSSFYFDEDHLTVNILSVANAYVNKA
jgi:hypothetical protein